MIYIPQIYDNDLKQYVTECPFKVRDLKNDECYSGNGKNRCEWFVRYDWEHHYGCIACSHPQDKQKDDLEGQLLFNF